MGEQLSKYYGKDNIGDRNREHVYTGPDNSVDREIVCQCYGEGRVELRDKIVAALNTMEIMKSDTVVEILMSTCVFLDEINEVLSRGGKLEKNSLHLGTNKKFYTVARILSEQVHGIVHRFSSEGAGK